MGEKEGEKVGEKVGEKTRENVGESLGEIDKRNLCPKSVQKKVKIIRFFVCVNTFFVEQLY